MTPPIKRGTARRLGLRPPDPFRAVPQRIMLGLDGGFDGAGLVTACFDWTGAAEEWKVLAAKSTVDWGTPQIPVPFTVDIAGYRPSGSDAVTSEKSPPLTDL